MKKFGLRLTGRRICYFVFVFFLFLNYVYLHEAFVKNVMKKLSFFSTNFQNLFQDVVYYRILGYQAL